MLAILLINLFISFKEWEGMKESLVRLQTILVSRGCPPFGRHQKSRPLGTSNFPSMSKSNRFAFSANQIVRLDSEHAQSDGKSVNRGLPVLDLFLVLTKRSAASGDETGSKREPAGNIQQHSRSAYDCMLHETYSAIK